MKNRLKDLYGTRITPVVRLFLLVVIVLLGFGMACSAGSRAEKAVDNVRADSVQIGTAAVLPDAN